MGPMRDEFISADPEEAHAFLREVYTENTMRIADFSFRTGRIKNKVEAWQELFFEDAHHLPGS